MEKLAIDFGTTNSVIARWDENQAACQVVGLPEMSALPTAGGQPVIPSLLYVQDGQGANVIIGQRVRANMLDRQRSNRLFRNFKRGILDEESQPRYIDGHPWCDKDAGRLFVQTVLQALPYRREQIDQLVLTVPVMAFDGYVLWLHDAIQGYAPDKVRIVDESTAAALGYAITEPDAPVLVFDFGGGSLDLSLVELPQGRAQTGGFLHNLLGQGAKRQAARVVAKSGLMLGGSDVDRWLFNEVLRRAGLSAERLGDDAAPLLSACEQAKIALSSQPQAEIVCDAVACPVRETVTQAEFEALLEANGFFDLLRQAIDKLMLAAHRRGIYREDIPYVLLIGGTSLMPAVQRTLRQYFSEKAVRVDKPFTAVAEGALQVALGYGLEDYLTHGYGLRCLDAASHLHYEEILPMGSRYPTEKPVRLRLGAAHPDQKELEFVIGEIDAEAVTGIEVHGQGEQAVFLADGKSQKVDALNPGEQSVAVRLDPPGKPGKDRLQVDFNLDDQLQLHLTVLDLQTHKVLLRDAPLTSLRQRADSRKAERGVYLVAPEDNFQYDTSQPDWEEKFKQDSLKFHLQNLANVGDAAGGRVTLPEDTITGREPRLAGGQGGRFHVSLRGLANVLGSLQPAAIPLEVAAEALGSTDFLTRYGAAEMLSRRSDAGARQLLEKTLHAGTSPQRASVARHLFRLPWDVAESLIRHALADPDRRVRSAAISALCQLRTPAAYQILGEALPAENDVVRLAAAWGLAQNPEPAAVPIFAIVLQSRDPEVLVKGLEVLGEIKSPAGIALARQIVQSANLDVKYAAVLSLIELAEGDAFPDVIGWLGQTSGLERQAILRGFFHATNYLFMDLSQSASFVELIAVLNLALLDALPETRLAAILPLIWMRHPQTAAMITNAYHRETDGETKAQMLAAAVNLMSPVAAELLASAASDANPDIRALAEYLRSTRRI
jgi:molecular chaperone DnaK (HSP70)/HEAT repeat protein